MDGAEAPPRGKLAVIIPAYNAAATLGRCLAAVAASTRRPDEIILFDDGSTDETPAIARRFGVRILTNEGLPLGPAVGRNRAARASEADILIFIDADVVIHDDALALLEEAVSDDPSIAAAFGSYDRSPPVRRLAALYVNLRHHFIHQHAEREAVTFWSGLGAVRRDAFLAAGGFDDRFSQPAIEDIDLGARLRAAGMRIRIAPEAQGGHCKDWTLFQLWETDIFKRAIPWAVVMASGQGEKGGLNAAPREQAVAALAHGVWIFAIGAFFNGWLGVAAAAAACAYLWANRRFFGLLAEVGGAKLALAGACLHWLYHVYASAIFGAILIGARLGLSTSSLDAANARNTP